GGSIDRVRTAERRAPGGTRQRCPKSDASNSGEVPCSPRARLLQRTRLRGNIRDPGCGANPGRAADLSRETATASTTLEGSREGEKKMMCPTEFQCAVFADGEMPEAEAQAMHL